jgi:hypothetical protein
MAAARTNGEVPSADVTYDRPHGKTSSRVNIDPLCHAVVSPAPLTRGCTVPACKNQTEVTAAGESFVDDTGRILHSIPESIQP